LNYNLKIRNFVCSCFHIVLLFSISQQLFFFPEHYNLFKMVASEPAECLNLMRGGIAICSGYSLFSELVFQMVNHFINMILIIYKSNLKILLNFHFEIWFILQFLLKYRKRKIEMSKSCMIFFSWKYIVFFPLSLSLSIYIYIYIPSPLFGSISCGPIISK
jgi:hypothetical protein